jgi:hypothetical protein
MDRSMYFVVREMPSETLFLDKDRFSSKASEGRYTSNHLKPFDHTRKQTNLMRVTSVSSSIKLRMFLRE